MLAVFQYHPFHPWHQASALPSAWVLEGEFHDGLAWDLVEQFFDDLDPQDAIRSREAAAVSGVVVLHGTRPSLSRTLHYHETRFTEAWWKKQEWAISDFLGHYQLGDTGLAGFRERHSPQALLALYLTTMVGRYFVRPHGLPSAPLDAKVAMTYFETHGYLRWLDARDPHAVARLVDDEPRDRVQGGGSGFWRRQAS